MVSSHIEDELHELLFCTFPVGKGHVCLVHCHILSTWNCPICRMSSVNIYRVEEQTAHMLEGLSPYEQYCLRKQLNTALEDPFIFPFLLPSLPSSLSFSPFWDSWKQCGCLKFSLQFPLCCFHTQDIIKTQLSVLGFFLKRTWTIGLFQGR